MNRVVADHSDRIQCLLNSLIETIAHERPNISIQIFAGLPKEFAEFLKRQA
ncbi:protein of unknown function [Nitratireductor aquimarinus]